MTLRRALGVAALLVALAALWLGAALRPAAADHPLDQSLGVAMTDYGNDPSVLVDQLTRLQTHWWFEFVWSGAGDPPGFTKVELLRPCYARDASLMCTSPGPSVAEVQARAQQKPGRYWMLGNEPNTVDQDNLSPSAYATFLYTYGTAIKQADPTARIVAPNVLNSTVLCQACAGGASSLGGAAFTQQVWTAYTQAYSGTAYPTPDALVDVWALHAYQIAWDLAILPPWTNAAWAQGEIAHYRQTLTAQGVPSSKPLWVTGWGSLLGYPCWENTSQGVRFNCAYDDVAVSQFIQTMVGWLRTTGLTSYNVQRSFLYANFAYPELWQAQPAARAATIRLFASPTLNAPLSPQGQVYANLVGFGPAWPGGTPPTVVFAPSVIPQGGALTVSGGGFMTSTTTATVRLVDSVATTTTVAALGAAPLSAGSFGPLSLTVPLTVSVGTYRVQATDGLLTATSAATLTVSAEGPPPPRWLQLSDNGAPGSPSRRFGHVAAWDSQQDRLLVFGGWDLLDLQNVLNDLWTWNPVSGWRQLVSQEYDAPGRPRQRADAAAVWDAETNRLLLFGGYSGLDGSQGNDLWAWTATGGWQQLTVNGAPGSPRARLQHAGAWDSQSDRLLVFGGYDGTGSPLNDLWSWSASAGWQQLSLNGAMSAPVQRWVHSAAWDSRGNRLLIFGGNAGRKLNDLWAWSSGDGWVLLAPEGADGSPAPRDGAVAVWDNASDRLLVFGGWGGSGSPQNDLWAWSSAGGWRQLTAHDEQGSPRRRAQHTGVWDSQHGRFIIFGGRDGNAYLNDLWTFGAPIPPVLLEAEVSFSPATVPQGGQITVSGMGFTVTATSATVRLVDASSPTVTVATLGTVPVRVGSFDPSSFTVLTTVAPGVYRVRATDNAGVSGTSVATLTVSLRLPDLVISGFSAGPAVCGQSIPLTITVANVGTAGTGASFHLHVFADLPTSPTSSTGSPARMLETSALAAGAPATVVADLPASALSIGTHTLWAMADGHNSVFEINEANNTAVLTLTVGADCSLAILAAPLRAAHDYAFGVQPRIVLRDTRGVTLSADSSTVVTLTIEAGTGASGASLTCDQTSGGITSAVAVGGVATFSGCQIDRPGAGYVLEATVAGLPPAQSAPFNVTLAGDTDGDCRVSILDYSAVVTHFGKTGATADWREVAARPWRADLDGDERVDVVDHSIAVTRFGAQAATCAVPSDPSAVP